MRELAQTNLQLYEQLISLGWTSPDLAAVRGVYQLSAQLFSGRYRASGKTFVAHVVGTASCVAAVGGTPQMVSAALLHAAYEQGDFGPDQDRAHRRARLVHEVGPEIEALVAEYTATPLNVATIEDLQRRAPDLPSLTRDVVFIRIANEVDDHLDGGTDVAARVDYELYRADAVRGLADLALALGNADLAALMASVNATPAPVPEVLRSSMPASVLVPPASYRRRRTARSVLRAVRRRLARLRR